MDSAGNLYGTTLAGGNCAFYPFANNCGTVFELAPDGTKTVLQNFKGDNDGLAPWAPLIIDPKGNLYGTTYYGGSLHCVHEPLAPKGHGYGCGTVYKVTPGGKETVLYAFVARNGALPQFGSLSLGAHGELYGAAPYGGNTSCVYGCGTVFSIKP